MQLIDSHAHQVPCGYFRKSCRYWRSRPPSAIPALCHYRLHQGTQLCIPASFEILEVYYLSLCISYQPSPFCWQRKSSSCCGCVRASTEEAWMHSFCGWPVHAHAQLLY